MRAFCRGVAALVPGVFIIGCSVIPDIPPDFALPVREILSQTACELQDAFLSLDSSPDFRRFNARKWLITMSLAPKVDTDVNANGGWTRKNPFSGNPSRFTTWA